MERTFVMVKPDGVQRGLVSEVIGRFERKGFKIAALKMMRIDRGLAERHYGEHQGKPFFEGLVSFITSGPVVAMVIEGSGVIQAARDIMGATNPLKAAPGTIRGSFAVDVGRNVVHGSDSPASAEREISLFFADDQIIAYDRTLDTWLYE